MCPLVDIVWCERAEQLFERHAAGVMPPLRAVNERCASRLCVRPAGDERDHLRAVLARVEVTHPLDACSLDDSLQKRAL